MPAAAKILPEFRILSALAEIVVHQDAMVAAAEFTERVAEEFKKTVVRREDRAVRREVDPGERIVDRGEYIGGPDMICPDKPGLTRMRCRRVAECKKPGNQ